MTAAPSYPRDLIGYGRDAPHAGWPGNARIAVQFVLNYEEGGESCVLHGDKASEQFLSEIGLLPKFSIFFQQKTFRKACILKRKVAKMRFLRLFASIQRLSLIF